MVVESKTFHENGHWGFEDINFWEAERFNSLEKG